MFALILLLISVGSLGYCVYSPAGGRETADPTKRGDSEMQAFFIFVVTGILFLLVL